MWTMGQAGREGREARCVTVEIWVGSPGATLQLWRLFRAASLGLRANKTSRGQCKVTFVDLWGLLLFIGCLGPYSTNNVMLKNKKIGAFAIV